MVNFHKAMELVRSEFLTKVHFYANDWWEAYSIVAAAVEARFEVRFDFEASVCQNLVTITNFMCLKYTIL